VHTLCSNPLAGQYQCPPTNAYSYCLSGIFDDKGPAFLILCNFVFLNKGQKNAGINMGESH
jgi:hypothetical protein